MENQLVFMLQRYRFCYMKNIEFGRGKKQLQLLHEMELESIETQR